MCVLNLLILLLVATRPTRSVTTEPGHGWGEPLGSGQANVASRIASSTFSDTKSQSHEWTMHHDKTQGNSLLAFDFSNINPVDQFGESSSMNELHSSPGSKIDASHISIDSQQLSQEGENLDCLIDPNRIPIKSKISPSKDSFENLVPDNRNAHQFGDSSSKNLADWNPSTSSNRDASRISIDGQQSIESVEGKTFDCRIENTINSKTQPVDVRENFVPDGFPEQTQKIVRFRDGKYLVGLRMLCRVLNWDLDEVKDYDSLCVFLGKETNPEQVEFHDSVAITEHMMKLLVRGKSGRNTVEVGQNKIDVPDNRLIAKATSTLQKLILISNFVLKLVSCRRSLSSASPNVIDCLKRTCIPVLQCLVKCCGKDMDLFQTRWGTLFKHSNFNTNCCPGLRSNHHTCGYQMTKIVRNPDNRFSFAFFKNTNKNSGSLDLKALVGAVQKSTTSEEKLNLCCEFNEKYRSSGTLAHKTLRQYYNQSPKPIWGCFVHHCGQNTNEWIRKWGPEFAHGDFGRRKCQGVETQLCGLIDPPFDIPERHKLRSKPTRDLLPAISEILEQYDQFVITKTASMKSPHPGLTTMITKCRPIYNCLNRHCAGSVEEFVRRWGESVSYTKFSRNCCPGPGRQESDVCPYNSRSSQP
uniref:Uncharacterized protein n=1 Tax=Spongospora subterranea TaxID=70186 RepID=A0A0H5REK9_9EUKA|eukprot:CRZ07019.1 hypothetical protein [Spongospora subterranea]